ncbi:MAG: hypothetical protein R2739_04755 [Chitinophagales bacterium]|nr:hypothetical protein [Bacteroidota bacterium]
MKRVQVLIIVFVVLYINSFSQTGNVGIGTTVTSPSEKLQVGGNILIDNNLIANKGLITGKIETASVTTRTLSNSYYWTSVVLSNGYGANAVSIYKQSGGNGGFVGYDGTHPPMKISGIDISNLLTTSHTWYKTTNSSDWGSTSTTQGNASGVYSNNTSNMVYCPDGSIVTGWETSVGKGSGATWVEGYLHVRCTQLASGYTTVETGSGIESILNTPNSTTDNLTHLATCPTGTFIKGISTYRNGSYINSNLRVNCTGIKKQ